MAKGNPLLGLSRGKLGDMVLYRAYGEQCSRPRVIPKNPQTGLQLLQRVVLKTVSGAYSLLKPIADHSFQGKQVGTMNQSRFAQVNIGLLRSGLADEINDGSLELIVNSQKTNFAPKDSMLPEINAYQISEGSLPAVSTLFTGGLFTLVLPGAQAAGATLTYQGVLNALGLQEGDQLTFCLLSTDDTEAESPYQGRFNGFKFARVILQPANGDLTSDLIAQDGTINQPNVRNEGSLVLSITEAGNDLHLNFSTQSISTNAGMANSVAAAAVIVSRNSGGVWQRSTQSLVLRPADLAVTGHLNFDNEVNYLGDAVVSFMSSERSSLYLNQAGSF